MRLRTLIVIIVLTSLLIAYYWGHKPFDISLAQTLAGLGLDLIPMALLAVCAGSGGTWLLARFKVSFESRAERLTIATLLGLGIIANAALLMGLLGGYRPVILWPILALVGGAALIVTRGAWLSDCRAVMNQVIRPSTPWTRFLMLFVAFVLGTGLLAAMTPPVMTDALTYHMVGIQRDLASGRIVAQPDNPYLGFAQNAEMLYGLAVGLFGRDTAATPIHWLFGVLALLGTGAVIRRRLGKENEALAWVAVAILLSGFSLWLLLGWPYVDLGIMAYGAAILITLGNWRDTQPAKWLILSGICLGLALGVKLTGAALLVATGVYVVTHTIRKGLRSILGAGLILVSGAFLAYVPWLVKDALLYHNPIYPYIFNGVGWDNARALRFDQVNEDNDGLLGSPDAWQWPLLPLSATLFGDYAYGKYGFTAGPWMLMLPFVLVLTWRWLRSNEHFNHLAKDCVVLVLPLLAIWWVVSSFSNIGIQLRLMIAGLPAIAVLGSLALYSLKRWPSKAVNLYFIFQALFVLSLLLECMQIVQYGMTRDLFEYTTAAVGRNEFLSATLGSYYDAMQHLSKLPSGTKVQFVWELRGYYCPISVNCVADPFLDNWRGPFEGGKPPDAIFADWQHQGDDYVLVYNNALNYFKDQRRSGPSANAFAATLPRWLDPVWSNDQYTLYTWRSF